MGGGQHYKSRRRAGFTIVEVLIVLAIAGLLLLLVFLLVPTLQRNARNYGRKHAADRLLTEFQEYIVNHNGMAPQTTAEGQDFMDSLPDIDKELYTLEYHDRGKPHNYVPEMDTITVQFGHWCNRYGDGDAPDDILAGHVNSQLFVVWTQLEPEKADHSNVYCIDSSGRTPATP